MKNNVIDISKFLNKDSLNLRLDDSLNHLLYNVISEEIFDFKKKLELSKKNSNIEATNFNRRMIRNLNNTLKQLKEHSQIAYNSINILLAICELKIERINLELLFLDINSNEFNKENTKLKHIVELHNILKDKYDEYSNNKELNIY
ncbi:hypothetical protein BFS06_11575 [Clostridium perfringens]|uniref:Uncharacterized protein n=1 Tax=Clostridium perfringens TaxID=1502 RepID=A0A140GS23_CLOPF|nr:hypothetical protein [Clostridium perfringens]AMN31332.1 hypothetical protein JFP838_pA0416 [Clostridium perfringens]TBX14854.1 hypothetical protein BFS06_11575 [Clostridium perfringens]